MGKRRWRRWKPEIGPQHYGEVCAISARQVQIASQWLRTFMIQKDPEALAKCILALRYPTVHSSPIIFTANMDVWKAQLDISRYAATGNFKYLQDALKALSDAERRLWEGARLYRLFPYPQAQEIKWYVPTWLDTLMDKWPVKTPEDVIIQTAVWSLAGICRVPKYIKGIPGHEYILREIDIWQYQVGQFLKARAPQVWTTLLNMLKQFFAQIRP